MDRRRQRQTDGHEDKVYGELREKASNRDTSLPVKGTEWGNVGLL